MRDGSGGTGIRTLEGLAPLTVFKTVAFVRSAILPNDPMVAVRPVRSSRRGVLRYQTPASRPAWTSISAGVETMPSDRAWPKHGERPPMCSIAN